MNILSQQTRNFNVPRCLLVKPVILSETVLSNSVNLHSHQQGQDKTENIESHTLCVDKFHRFLNIMVIKDGCICNGNRTELSPIRSVNIIIIPVVNNIGRPRSGSQFVNQEHYSRQN